MSNLKNEDQSLSPADYRDFDLAELQIVADYITKQSVPQGLTMIEAQRVVSIYSDFLNLSLYNLNLLRSLAGEPEFPIPTKEESDAIPAMDEK